MLEPWIIEQIRRREEEERRRNERPQLELPVSNDNWPPRTDKDKDKNRRDRQSDDSPDREDDDEPQRGVVIIGL